MCTAKRKMFHIKVDWSFNAQLGQVLTRNLKKKYPFAICNPLGWGVCCL